MLSSLATFVPASWYPFLLAAATWLFDMYERFTLQKMRTLNAVIKSFKDEVVGWSMTSPLPYDLSNESHHDLQFYDLNSYAIHNLTKNTIKVVFNDYEHKYNCWRNPYLAITLLENGKELADMSSWLETLVLQHNVPIEFRPFTILLKCFSYANNIHLKYLNDMSKYTFSVITEIGDFKVIDIFGEQVDNSESKEA